MISIYESKFNTYPDCQKNWTILLLLENYPETLKAAYVINAGSVFQLVFRLVQALVQQRTLSKIQIHGSDAELWRAEVRAKVEQFGPEVNRGGQVPRELYLENGWFTL